MLGIPFLSTAVRRRKEKKQSAPAVPEIVKPADGSEAGAGIGLVAGKALMVMGRYIEAFEHVEEYLKEQPDSVEGMITAGLIAARMGQVAMAQEWFNRGSVKLEGRAKELMEPVLEKSEFDMMDIEDLVAEAEAHPEDKERVLALACALGRAGHFRAVERFVPSLES